MTVTSQRAGTRSVERRLRRDVGRISLLFVGVGSIIGSGWLFGDLNTAKEGGPAGIFSWALGPLQT